MSTTPRRFGPLPTAILLAIAIAVLWSPARPALPPGIGVDDRVEDRVVGTVTGPVTTTARGTGAVLEVDDAEVWLWTDRALAPGERIAARGLVRTPRGLAGPAMPDRRADAHRYELSATHVERLGEDGGLGARAWRWAAATQARWSRRIEAAGGEPAARAALRGIVIGDRSDIPPALDERWRAVGIYHVLSVSGLHLAVVAGLAYALLRRLVAASPWGGRVRPARWAAPPALAIALAYTLVTGAQLATVRALIVVAIVLVAAMLDRPVRLLDALGAAAIAILAWHPGELFDPSFQLSFTAALTLALRPPSTRRGLRAHLVRGLATSAWVTITTAPLTAYHFQQVTPGGVVGNLVLAPLLELVALPLALAGTALGELGAPLVRGATWIVAQLDHGAALLALGTPVGRVAVASALVAAILVALGLVLAARARRTRLDLALWIALCVAWSFARVPAPDGALRVTFLDVGQGDAALVELPDGSAWLIDAGGHASARDLRAASAPGQAIARTLAAYGHDRIELAILSHPHPDHYLGLAALPVPIGELWAAPEPEREPAAADDDGRSFRSLAAQLAARGTRLVHPPLGLARRQAGVELRVWGPRYRPADGGGEEHCAADPVRGVNDNSLVVTIHYRGRTLLFTGDLEAEGEELLVAANVPRVDVVKVPHHGSPTSSSESLVAATRPALAVISCGRGNTFGFPAAAVVARWREAGADVARTDTDGAITVIIDAAGNLAVDRFVVE